MMIHRDSVMDVDFRVQIKCEFNDLKRVLMVIRLTRGWLLTMALAWRSQHTARRNRAQVTVVLPRNSPAGSRCFEYDDHTDLWRKCHVSRHGTAAAPQLFRLEDSRSSSRSCDAESDPTRFPGAA